MILLLIVKTLICDLEGDIKVRSHKKTIKNLILFMLLIIVTFYIILKDQDIGEIAQVLRNVKLEYVLIGIIVMLIYFALETINMGRTLKKLNEQSNFIRNFKYVLVGFFFSSITPAASGGQPMQIYYMHKDGISVANSTLTLLINLCSFQIITISFAMISLIFNYQYLTTGLVWLFIIGVLLNSIALSLLLIGIFSKRLSAWLVKVAVKILTFFKVKNIEEKQEKFEKELYKYQGSAAYIKQNIGVMVKTVLTTFVQISFYYSIPYWVYCSFGFSEYNITQIISLQAILYATVSGIPLPGAVGVSEGGFLGIFKTVFTATTLNSAMILNRGVSFYLFVLFSAIVVIIQTFFLNKQKNLAN